MKAGWEVKQISEICLKTETVDPRKSPDVEFIYVDVSSVSNETYKVEQPTKLTGADAPSRARRLIREGDILFATIRPTLKRIAQVPPDLDGQICSTGYAVLRPRSNLDARFLMYSLFRPEFLRAMETLQSGASYPAVTEKQIRAQTLPLPPLEEQQRIVAVLDEAFEGLDRARENAEANLESARELFTASVDTLLNTRGESWCAGTFENSVGRVFTGPFGSLLHKSDYVENGVPLVNPANIVDGSIVPDLRKTVDASALDRLSSYVLSENDIVIGRRGEMGRCAVVEQEQAGWLCGTGSFYIRPKPGVLSAFVAHLLQTPTYVAKLEAMSTGATMANLSNKSLAELEIKLPDRNTQAEILQRIEGLASETSSAKEGYSAKNANLADLRQSLLQKAFAGELT